MPTTTPATDHPRRAAFPSAQWWVRDRDGRVVIAQPPNAAILVWLATVVVRWSGVLDDRRSAVLTHVGQGALLVWALDELVRGASPVRRVLGLVVLVAVAVRVLG